MSDTFHLHNRGLTGGDSSSTSKLESYALDRKNLLENIVLQLKKMVTHLSLVTDDKVSDGDILED